MIIKKKYLHVVFMDRYNLYYTMMRYYGILYVNNVLKRSGFNIDINVFMALAGTQNLGWILKKKRLSIIWN